MAPIPRLVRLTDPAEGEHFTGYYDLNPWSADGKRLLYLEVRDPAVSRLVPDGSQFARVMVMDGASGARQCIGTTNAWNWQLGARQQWLGGNIPTFNLDATQTMHAFWRFPSVRSLAAVAINFHRHRAGPAARARAAREHGPG